MHHGDVAALRHAVLVLLLMPGCGQCPSHCLQDSDTALDTGASRVNQE
jgi:hypothetical protein